MTRLRAWLSNQAVLVELVADLERRVRHLTHAAVARNTRHNTELVDLRAQLDACRREAESLDAANQAVNAQNRWERMWGNQLAHRNRAAWEMSEQLPPDVGERLRAALSLTLPAEKEPTRAD